MAIVKMKKLRAMALSGRREELLAGLLRLGCVEISEPNLADPAWAALVRRETSPWRGPGRRSPTRPPPSRL